MKDYSKSELLGGNGSITPRVPYVGETRATIIAVDPSLEKLAEYGINYTEEPALTFTSEKTGQEFRILRYLLEIHTPSGFMYDVYSTYLSDRAVKTKEGKVLVMDDSLNYAYVPETKGTVADMVDQEISRRSVDDPDSYYVRKLKGINKATARMACEGELKFYQELFEMTRLRRNGQPYTNEKGEKVEYKLEGFLLGEDVTKATEEFKKLVAGDNTELIKALKSPSFCESDGTPIEIGVVLGLVKSDKRNQAGEPIYYPEICNRWTTCSIFRPATKPKQVTVTLQDKSSITVQNTRLSRDLIADLYNTNPQYGWSAIFELGPIHIYVPKEKSNEIVDDVDLDDDIPF